jgi:hypothetical protein
MTRPRLLRDPATLLGALIGGSFFLWICSWRFVDPTEIGWVMRFDWATHYFGWKFFRNEPWHWPPATVHGYNAPIGTAIGLTDSLPLLAYALKPFASWLPEDIQYLGAWEWFCYAMQGALGARLAGRFTPHLLPRLLAAALLVSLPMLLFRVVHAALCAHWLILWCLLIATRPAATMFRAAEWAALGFLAGMIQPYLAAMVAVLLAAITVIRNQAPLPGRALSLAAAAGTMLTGWWLSGMFALGGAEGLAAHGVGVYSTNLLAPISPYGMSRLMPDLPHAGVGQLLEGAHYYGAGVLLLIVVAGVVRWLPRRTPAAAPPPIFAVSIRIVVVVLAAVALSPRVTMGERVLVDLTGPWAAPLALFRSTGRFLWPLTYVVLAWTIATLVRRTSPRVGAAVLALGLTLQAVDVSPFYLSRRQIGHDPAFYAWDNPFVSRWWERIAPNFEHLVLWPPPQCGTSPVAIEPALWFGARYGLTVNTGTLSRGSDVARARYCERLRDEVAAGALAPDAIYLVMPATAAAIEAAPGAPRCGRLDALTLCTAAASYGAWQRYVTGD